MRLLQCQLTNSQLTSCLADRSGSWGAPSPPRHIFTERPLLTVGAQKWSFRFPNPLKAQLPPSPLPPAQDQQRQPLRAREADEDQGEGGEGQQQRGGEGQRLGAAQPRGRRGRARVHRGPRRADQSRNLTRRTTPGAAGCGSARKPCSRSSRIASSWSIASSTIAVVPPCRAAQPVA